MIADAGGLPVAGGGRLREGRLLRVSGALVMPDDLVGFEAYGLRSLVDLRGSREDRSLLERWAAAAGVRYVWLPIDAGRGGRTMLADVAASADASEAAARLAALYEELLARHGTEIANAIAAIAQGTPAAFGCAAGKDRTGLVAALLQVLLGVDEADAARSYASSPPPVERLRAMVIEHFDIADELLAGPGLDALLGAEEETMRATLEHVRSEHGGVGSYLRAHGLATEDVERLRSDVVELG